jgi:hypothetical protein
VRIALVDGPCDGRSVSYGSPLPPVLVVADRTSGITWHDYAQTAWSQRYRHSKLCKCHERSYPPVNLDSAVS